MRDTAADSIVPGPGLVCEERVAWVNAVAIDFWESYSEKTKDTSIASGSASLHVIMRKPH